MTMTTRKGERKTPTAVATSDHWLASRVLFTSSGILPPNTLVALVFRYLTLLFSPVLSLFFLQKSLSEKRVRSLVFHYYTTPLSLTSSHPSLVTNDLIAPPLSSLLHFHYYSVVSTAYNIHSFLFTPFLHHVPRYSDTLLLQSTLLLYLHITIRASFPRYVLFHSHIHASIFLLFSSSTHTNKICLGNSCQRLLNDVIFVGVRPRQIVSVSFLLSLLCLSLTVLHKHIYRYRYIPTS